MTDKELVELYLKTHSSGGGWMNFIKVYRTISESSATDASLRAWLSKRITEIRSRTAWIFGDERAKEMIPRLQTPSRNRKRQYDAVADFVIEELIKKEIL